jgi:hypothetical protein
MSIEAMKQALEALQANDVLINGSGTHGGLAFAMDGYYSGCFDIDGTNEKTEQAITALRQAIEQAEMIEKGTKAWADTPDKWMDDFWGWVEKQEPEPEKIIPIAVHVIPINDLREHTASVGCWCKPTEDDEWPDVWVHHSMDRREDYEAGKEKNT